jgi:DNA-binding IclR family transcriptional regulator
VIQSVDRAVRVLTALQGSRRLALSELAARLELPPSTVHGLVRTLMGHGLVVQERGSTRYQLGPAVLRLGNVYLDTLELRSKAVPWGEVIHHEAGPDRGRQVPEVGVGIPAHASALGKAILAFDRDAAASLREPLRSMTGGTITSRSALDAELGSVRRTGIALEQEEALLGECGAAAPVFDATIGPVGAIGVVVPASSWPVDPATQDAVRGAAQAISRELGARAWLPRGAGPDPAG